MTRTVVCDICGREYPGGEQGGHCRGGRFGGCCASFASDTLFAQHRMALRCLTPAEMVEKGWLVDERGWWHGPQWSGKPRPVPPGFRGRGSAAT
jgi:hypothetical protein